MSDQPYIVSARKYRPATFQSVVGQKALTATLKNAVESQRLAQAYLFCGPRGVGKTSCARIFAKTINCLSPTPDGEACGKCEACRAIEDGSSFNIVELDAASNNSVDDIRTLTEQVNIPPTIGKYRVFIIDEVHMLSSQAFNAFLKTLEEPPAYVVFILATTEKHKVIPTILSRCQIYDFKRITIQDMVEHLQYVASQEGITADVASLNVIAKKADGAMRDALSIFDQVAASSFGNITYESTIASLNVLDYDYYFRLVEAFKAGDIPGALLIYKDIRDHGFDSLFFVNGLANHVRDLMVAFSPQTASLLEVADDVAAQYRSQSLSLPADWHYAAMKLLNDCDFQYRTASNKQLLVELTLIRLCQLLKPPTPPFDRVDSDSIPLRDPAMPHSAAGAAIMTDRPAPAYVASTPATTPTSAPRQTQPAPASPPATNHVAPGAAATSPASQVPTSPTSPNPGVAVSVGSAPSVAPAQATPTAGHTALRRRTGRSAAQPAAGAALRITAGAAAGADSGQYQRLREPVTLEAVHRAWEDFIIKNPDKHILISAMRKGLPTQKDAETFRVVVDHPALRQAFELEMPELIAYIRSVTRNDFVSLEVDIDDAVNVVKQLPPQQLLSDIISSNPVLGSFIAGLDAELV